MEYTTLALLKNYLGITGTDNDAELSRIITSLTESFNGELGRNLEKADYEDYNFLNDERIIFVRFPINEIETLKTNDENGTDINYKRFSGNTVILENKITGDVYIKYSSGYNLLSEIPDLENAFLESCRKIWEDRVGTDKNNNIQTEKVGDLSQSYFSPTEIDLFKDFNLSKVLKKYKSIIFKKI